MGLGRINIPKGERVLGLKRLPQHLLRFVHDDQELGIEMADQRRGQSR